MTYIDKNYYTLEYLGKVIPAADFSRLASRASDIIDSLTYGKAARAKNVIVKDAVKKATAAQAEYLFVQGDYDSYTGIPENTVTKEDIGTYSYSKKEQSNSKSLGGIPISPLALSYLDAVGLRSCVI